MSLILRPPFAPDWSAILSLCCVVAVAEALISLTRMPIRICWPNDLYIGHQKLGGVLVEILSDMEAITHAIVGIGLNVNSQTRHFPAEILETATSLRLQSGRNWDRIHVLQEILLQLEEHYWTLDDGQADRLLNRWRELDLLIGRHVSLETMEGIIEGVAMDISPDGRLLVQDDQGNVLPVMGGKWRGGQAFLEGLDDSDDLCEEDA